MDIQEKISDLENSIKMLTSIVKKLVMNRDSVKIKRSRPRARTPRSKAISNEFPASGRPLKRVRIVRNEPVLIVSKDRDIIQIDPDEIRKANFERFQQIINRRPEKKFKPAPPNSEEVNLTFICELCKKTKNQKYLHPIYSSVVNVCKKCSKGMNDDDYITLCKERKDVTKMGEE